MVAGSNLRSSGSYDLKNPNFRYMSTPQAPPGSLQTNPTETFFDAQSAVPTGDQTQQQRMPSSLGQITVPTQVMRSLQLPGGYSYNQHVAGVLQTGTDAIPVVNGSILSPSIQQQGSSSGVHLTPADSAHTTSPLYVPYAHSRSPQQGVIQGRQYWMAATHSAAHQIGMGTGGVMDGPGQHGTGAIQYGMGAVAISSIPSGNVVYQQPQKWPSQQQTVLQAVAPHS